MKYVVLINTIDTLPNNLRRW